MKLSNHILLILIFGLQFITVAQNSVEFQQLRGENVSTQSITYAIAQDSIGNIWVASEEGILKHNSKSYKIYNTYNGLPEILSNRTTEIYIDGQQRKWAGSESGLSVYNPSIDQFIHVKSETDINPALVETISEDKSGVIWIGGYNGLWKYNESSKELERTIANLHINSISSLDDNLILGATNGLFNYNIADNKFQKIELPIDDNNISLVKLLSSKLYVGTQLGKIFELSDNLNTVSELHLDSALTHPIKDIIGNEDDGYYIATNGNGLYHYHSKSSAIEHYVEDNDSQISLSSNSIYDLEQNKEGILWIATYGGGINYIDSNKLPFKKIQHILNEENSLVADFTRAIAQDSKGNLWFGTKKGLSIFNVKNSSWKHISNLDANNNSTQDIVLALEPDGQYMWIGTYDKGLFKININDYKIANYNKSYNPGELITKIYAIAKDSKGNIWAGGISGDLAVIDKKGNLFNYPIQTIKAITETKSGDILAAGRNGVYRIDHNTRTFNLIEELKPNKQSLAYSTINSILELEDENLILGTNGEGIIFYNTTDKSLKKLSIYDGMPSDIVQGLAMYSKNNIWASTTKGLTNIRLSTQDTAITVYDQKDGLASTEYNYGSYRKLNDSLMAFGGVTGVTLFNPSKVLGKSFKPSLVFDEFKIANETIMPGDKPLDYHINVVDDIELEYGQNSIQIGFTGILHSSASKIMYSYKLEGFEENWSELSNQNFASYTNLNPGRYIFKVKAFNKYKELGAERQISITILSPWWATNKAYLFYGLLLIGIVYAIIHFTSVIVKKKHADEQIDFFNNITHEIKTPLTILLSSLDNVSTKDDNKDSKKRIKKTVKRINALFEQMLNFQKATSDDSLADVTEIDVSKNIHKVIQDFKPLLSERKIDLNVIDKLNNQFFYYDKDVLNKVIRNLLSNAIKYSNEGGKIIVNLNNTRIRELVIEIEDEGLGIPKDQQKHILQRYYRARNVINSQRPGTGLGLIMVKKLLERTGGSISFTSEENKGSTFSILFNNLIDQYKKNAPISERELEKQESLIISELDEIHEFSDSKILVVEDNDELRQILVETLANNFQVYEAENGVEGLAKAKEIFPDLILTDLIMPEMDGMQMSINIKKDISLNHIPVFMLTVLQNSEQKLESIEAGISEYIEKPIDIKFLLAKILNTLKWQKQLREKYVHDSDSDTAFLFRNKHDKEFLEELENTVLKNIDNNEFTVHDLSASFGMSRTSLYMKLKNLVDLSPQDFVIHTKLKKAKNLLIKGEFSIKEVAYRSGFSNPKYFSTSFKKFYGQTPSGFLSSLK